MKFINPEILWGLLVLAIPILVHLFNFRKFKKVYFSNVDFLKEIKEETKSKSKLKHLLILLSRLLTITALVLAFAQPYIPTTNLEAKIGNKAISLYIDNSFSMEAQNDTGRLLDVAKNKAISVAEAHKSTDKFQLLTNDFEGRHQRLVTKEDVINLIEEVRISPNTKQISEVLSRQKELLTKSIEPQKECFLFTDLQSSTFDLANINNDTTVRVRIIPSFANTNSNKFIDSLWFASPVRQLNKHEKLHVIIENSSSEKAINVPLKLSINGNQKAIANYSISEDSSIDSTLTFTNIIGGIKSAEVKITDFPVVFDDKMYFSYEVSEEINVLEITGKGIVSKPIKTIFQDDDFFQFESTFASKVDYSTLSNKQFIILNQLKQISSGMTTEIEKFVNHGGSILVIPATNILVDNYNQFLTKLQSNTLSGKKNSATKVSNINLDHPIYKGVFDEIPRNIDLPKIKNHYPINQITRNSSSTLLSLANGSSFLSQNSFFKGKVYLSSVSLSADESNFTQHAIFVASLLRIAELSQSTSKPYYEIGQDNVVQLKNIPVTDKSQIRVRKKGSDYEFIPGYRSHNGQTELFVQDQIKEAGNYEVFLDNKVLSAFSFNYSRAESDLKTTTTEAIQTIIEENNLTSFGIVLGESEQLIQQIEELDEGKKLWKILIFLALLFIVIEVLLMKFWK